MQRKFIILLLALGVVAMSILFRAEISRRLDLGVKEELSFEVKNINPSANKGNAAGGTAGTINSPIGSYGTPVKSVPPKYIGRDPSEARPATEDVKLFSEEQKRQMYSDIGITAKTVKENPDYFQGWLELGLLKKTIGDYEGARDAWEYASIIRPLNSVSFANLGDLYWHYLPDFPKSEKNYRISLKNKPSDVSNYVSLSDLYFTAYTKKRDWAEKVLWEGLDSNPGDETLMRYLAYLYEREDKPGQAIEWWKKVLAKNPGDKKELEERITKLEAKSGGVSP